MKHQNNLKVLSIRKSNLYNFTVTGVDCEIIESNKVFFSYVRGKWLENKDSSIQEALTTILSYIGIKKEVRDHLKIDIKDSNQN